MPSSARYSIDSDVLTVDLFSCSSLRAESGPDGAEWHIAL